MFHRVFSAFDQAFAVVGQFDRATGGVGDRRQLAASVVGERRRVAITISHAFQTTTTPNEFVFDLPGQRQRIASTFRAMVAEGACPPVAKRAFDSFGASL